MLVGAEELIRARLVGCFIEVSCSARLGHGVVSENPIAPPGREVRNNPGPASRTVLVIHAMTLRRTTQEELFGNDGR